MVCIINYDEQNLFLTHVSKQQSCSTKLIKHFLITFLFLLAKAHIHSALKSHEEAMKARQICRHCRKIVGLQKVNAWTSLQENTVFGISLRRQFIFYVAMLLIFLRPFRKLASKRQTH